MGAATTVAAPDAGAGRRVNTVRDANRISRVQAASTVRR